MNMRHLVVAVLLAVAVPAAAAPVSPRYIVDIQTGDLPRDGVWRPDQAEIAKAEVRLRDFLNSPKEKLPSELVDPWNEEFRTSIGERIDTYVLQFAGVRRGVGNQIYSYVGNGPRQILIEGICQVDAAKMKNTTRYMADVADGGECFFESLYDLNADEIVYFSVHGEA